MTVYLDQAAAARPAPEAIEFYFARVRENYANQEAAHRLGHDARQQLDRAAEELSLALTGEAGWKVIWGGCGTELFNLFADSPLAAGKCAITSPLEHPALLAVLRRSAAELRLLRPDRCGRILPEELPAGDLLALHQVQSELGTIQPIGPLAEAFRRNSPAGILFVDAIQGAAKLPFPREADIVAVSGRKFGAPGGGAALLIRPAFRGGKTLLEFARRWLGHRNPYTGMTWAEDPALYIVSFTNENNLYAKLAEEPGIAEQYRKLYPKWMKQHYPGEDPGRPLMNNRRFQEFLYTLQHESILEQAKFLKEELGLKALRTDLNMHNKIPLALIRADLDTVDDHKYQDHPRFPINRWKLPGLYRQRSSISDLGNEVPEQLFAARLFGKPFSITEYKFCVPNQFRSEGGPLIGGYAALQGWAALYQFAWSHSDWAVKQDIPLGNFDFANEPLSWLSDRLVMLLFRRGDVSPSKERFAWNVPKNFWNSDMPLEYPLDFSRLGLIAGIGTVVDNRQVPGVQVISANAAAGKAPLPDRKIQALRQTLLRTGVAESSTGELRLDSRKNTLAIQTPRTLSATLASGNLTAGALTVRQVTYPTTVSVSSLDDAPVARSGKLLLFHLTNVIDSGTTFKGEKMQYLLKWGKLPHLVRRAPAKVSLRLDGDTVPKVEALHFDGTVRGEVKSTFANGVLSFTADPGCFPGGVMIYWITRAE